MKKYRSLGSLALGTLLVAAAACSSSAHPAGSGAPTTGSAGASTTGSPINIGVIGQFSGAYTVNQGSIPHALNAWASSLNASGGLSGRTVHVIAKDTAQGVQPGLTDVHALIDQDHVIAIIDFDTDPDNSTWLPYAESANVPVIVASAGSLGSKTVLTDTDAYPIVAPEPIFFYAIVRTAKMYGPKMGVAYCSEQAICSAIGLGYQAAGKAIGEDVSVQIKASSSAPDYTFVCQDLKNAGVTSGQIAMLSASDNVAKTCYSQGSHIPLIWEAASPDPSWSTDPMFHGDPVVDFVGPYFANSTPAEQAYRNALQKYSPDVVGKSENGSTMEAWLGGQVIVAALSHTRGAISAASLKSGMYSLQGETLGGLVQPLTYSPNQPTWLPCYFLWSISNTGTFVPSNDSKPICEDQQSLNASVNALVNASH